MTRMDCLFTVLPVVLTALFDFDLVCVGLVEILASAPLLITSHTISAICHCQLKLCLTSSILRVSALVVNPSRTPLSLFVKIIHICQAADLFHLPSHHRICDPQNLVQIAHTRRWPPLILWTSAKRPSPVSCVLVSGTPLASHHQNVAADTGDVSSQEFILRGTMVAASACSYRPLLSCTIWHMTQLPRARIRLSHKLWLAPA
jgi:hypothetical protein